MPNRADSNFITQVNETYLSFRDSWQDARDKTEESLNFLLGKQWDTADEQSLDAKKMPHLTKNLILPIWNRVTGAEKLNRTDTVVVPAEDGMEEVAYAMTRLLYHYSNQNHLKNIFSSVFEYGLISDMGAYFRMMFTTEDDPMGSLAYRFIPGANVLRDPMARTYDPSHKNGDRRMIYTTWLTKEAAKAIYPDMAGKINELQDYRPGLFGRFVRTTGKKSDFLEQDATTKGSNYRVIEQWEMQRKRERIWYDPYEDKVYKPQNPVETEDLLFHRPEVIPRDMIKKTLNVKVTMGDMILLYEGDAKVQNGMYPFIGFYPYFIDGDMLGMIHNLKDYQREHNKRSSQILHILGMMGLPLWIARKGSVNVEKLEQEGGTLGAVITYTGSQEPKRENNNQVPQGHMYMDQESKAGMYETSGVSPNLMGRSDTAKETGILFENRVNEGFVMLQNLFDNYRLTKDIAARHAIWYFQNKFTEERIFTILNEQNKPERIPINQKMAGQIVNDLSIGKYDVVTENVANAASAKMQEDRVLYQLAKVTPAELVPWDEVWRKSGIRNSDKIADRIAQKLGVQDKVEQGMAEIAVPGSTQQNAGE